MIRFLCAAFSLILYLIVSIPLLIFLWIWSKVAPKQAYKRDRFSLAFVQSAFRLIWWCSGAKVTCIGEEKVPDGAVLFVGNHRSVFDIILTYPRMKNLTGFVSKSSMEKTPLFSTWMRHVKCLFLDRTNLKEGLKTILTAIDYIKSGISIVIFPEGTRNKGEESSLLPFKEGAVRIATKSNCPIVPLCITNSADVFEAHFPKLKPVKVIIEFGDPIYPDTLDKETKKQLGSYIANIIQHTISKNEKEYFHAKPEFDSTH